MEKRKLLLVAISVGLFLVITIGAALVVFAPKSAAASSAVVSRPAGQTGITVEAPYYQSPFPPVGQETGTAQETGTQGPPLDPVDLVRATDVPGLQTPPAGSVQQDSGFYISGSAQSGQEPVTLITVPRPSSAAVPDTPPAGRAAAPATRPAAPAPAPAAARPTPAAAQARPAPTRTYTDYWVQTGAFSTIARAEGVKESLSSKGIASIIENREVEGRTVFRVRVGPYTSQNEADYWLSLIRSIDGFEDSQVRVTQAQR